MKKYFVALSSLLVLIACLVTVQARPQVAQEPAAKAESGKVIAVDTAKNEFRVKDDRGAEKNVSVTADTKITKGGKEVALAELKNGDRVMYELDASAATPVAKMLMVMSNAEKP